VFGASRDRGRSGDRGRFGRIFLMKGLREIEGMFQVLGRFPRVVGYGIAFPLNEIYKLPTGDLGVEDFFDFVFGFFVDCDRGWGRLDPIGDSVLLVGLQQGDVEDGVDVHRCGELEPISLEADSLDDDKGSDALPIEFLAGSLGA